MTRERELESVLRILLNLHDPPTAGAARRDDEDELGWNMTLSGAVRRGRLLIPKPDVCEVCGGTGLTTCGCGEPEHECGDGDPVECGKCDGYGYELTPEPVSETERELWSRIGDRVRRP